jgi:hypothetical protein
VFDVRVVGLHFNSHLGHLPGDDLGSPIVGVSNFFTVRDPEKGDLRCRKDPAHVSKDIFVQLGRMQSPGVVDLMASGVILKMPSSKPMRCLLAHSPSPPSLGRQYPPMLGLGKIILLWWA